MGITVAVAAMGRRPRFLYKTYDLYGTDNFSDIIDRRQEGKRTRLPTGVHNAEVWARARFLSKIARAYQPTRTSPSRSATGSPSASLSSGTRALYRLA